MLAVGEVRMRKASVDLDHDVHKSMKSLKDKLGLKTMSDVVRLLLDHYQGRGQAKRGDGDDGEGRPMEEEEDEDTFLPQLISYALLAREPKAIKYFTGLNEECMDWVMGAMREAVRPISLFAVFRVRACRAIDNLPLWCVSVSLLTLLHRQSAQRVCLAVIDVIRTKVSENCLSRTGC